MLMGIELYIVSLLGMFLLFDVLLFVVVLFELIYLESSLEPSTFEPVAELAVDGKLHVLEQPIARPAEEAFIYSSADPSTPADASVPEARQNRFGALELEPLAVTVEPHAAEAAAPAPATPTRWKPVALGLVAVVVLGVAAFGVSKLKFPGRSAAAGALFIDSAPSGAVVLLGGQAVGETPWAGDNIAGGVTTIVLRRPGFIDATLRLDGGTDWSGTVKLTKGSSR